METTIPQAPADLQRGPREVRERRPPGELPAVLAAARTALHRQRPAR